VPKITSPPPTKVVFRLAFPFPEDSGGEPRGILSVTVPAIDNEEKGAEEGGKGTPEEGTPVIVASDLPLDVVPFVKVAGTAVSVDSVSLIDIAGGFTKSAKKR
jgi:hypothetical protein